MDVSGSVEEARASYIIRDFEKDAFETRKAAMQSIADKMNQELGNDRVTLTLTDQYYNMKEVIEKDMTPVTIAKAVMEDLGITPIIEPIRGGTDGSKISFMGIPTQISLLVVKTCMDVLNTSAFKLWSVRWIPSLALYLIKTKRRGSSATSPFFIHLVEHCLRLTLCFAFLLV